MERTFGETRRRLKVIGRLPGEQSCLSLVWAVLDRASAGWRGRAITPDALHQLQGLRRQLLEPPQGLHAPADGPPVIDADTAAASHHIGACVRGRLHQRWDATLNLARASIAPERLDAATVRVYWRRPPVSGSGGTIHGEPPTTG